jgi:hypothetical protein
VTPAAAQFSGERLNSLPPGAGAQARQRPGHGRGRRRALLGARSEKPVERIEALVPVGASRNRSARRRPSTPKRSSRATTLPASSCSGRPSTV